MQGSTSLCKQALKLAFIAQWLEHATDGSGPRVSIPIERLLEKNNSEINPLNNTQNSQYQEEE